MENAAAMLSYFCMDELEIVDTLVNHRSFVYNTLKANTDRQKTLLEVLNLPIFGLIAENCNFIYYFQESITLIAMFTGQANFKNHMN